MPFFPDVSIFSRTSEEWKQLLYDDREMCSKPGPVGYSICLTTAHIIAAPIYVVAFYTLYSEISLNFKVYKKYLAVHAVSNLIFEFHLSVVMKPVLYLPYPTIRFTGIYTLRYINGGVIFFVFLLIIVVTCWSIVELFHYRFELISNSNLSSTWVKRAAHIVKIARWALIISTFSTIFTLALSVVGLFDQTMHKKKLQIVGTYPEILCMSALILPKSSDTGLKPIHLFNGSALFSVIIGSFLCSFMGGISLLALREMVLLTKASMKTIKMHKAFLISLFCQISVHGLMLGFPVFIYVMSVIFNFDGNDVGYVAIVMASLHGTMSTLAMVLLNRPLYELFVSRIWRLFSSENIFFRDQSSFVSMGVSR